MAEVVGGRRSAVGGWPTARIWALLAGAGFALSLFVHVASLFGLAPLGKAAWGLHFGALVLGIPAIVALLYDAGRQSSHWWLGRQLDGPRLCAFARRAPLWSRWLAGATFVYAGLNFLLWLLQLQATDADRTLPLAMPGYSGHWMFFYALTVFVMQASTAPRQGDTNP